MMDLLKSIPVQDDYSTISAVVNSYHILDYKRELLKKLSVLFPAISQKSYSKKELHQVFNDLIRNRYQNEAYYKSLLVDYFIENEITSAFEIKVNMACLRSLKN